jgi:hypothetical protein
LIEVRELEGNNSLLLAMLRFRLARRDCKRVGALVKPLRQCKCRSPDTILMACLLLHV